MTLREQLHQKIDQMTEQERRHLARRLGIQIPRSEADRAEEIALWEALAEPNEDGVVFKPRKLGAGNWHGNISIEDDF